jgi:hypothetical protein
VSGEPPARLAGPDGSVLLTPAGARLLHLALELGITALPAYRAVVTAGPFGCDPVTKVGSAAQHAGASV